MKLRHLAIGVLMAALAMTGTPGRIVAAQQAPPPPQPPLPTKSQPVVLKGRAPVSKDVLQVKLPRPAEADLANGLHVMVLEDRRLPQISFQILIPGAGGYFDPADSPGLAVVTAAMMREGTTSRTTQQISELLETKAATVAVTSGIASAVGDRFGIEPDRELR